MVHERNLLRRFIGRIKVTLIEDKIQASDKALDTSLKLNELRGILRDILMNGCKTK
jgi:hypothetical protein